MEMRALLLYSGMMEWITRRGALRALDDGRHGFIRTPFSAFKYFMESVSSLVSMGSNLKVISVRSRPQSSNYYRVLFQSTVLRHRYFGPWVVYPVESITDAS